MKIILSCLFLLLFSGCKWVNGASLSPFAFLGIPEPAGTPIFKKGFSEGCSSVINTRGTELFRHRFKYFYDPSLMDNPEYTFGFSRGWSNCFNHIVSGRHTLGGSADTYIFGGDKSGNLVGWGRGSIDNTVNYSGTGSWGNPFGAAGAAGTSIDDIWKVTQNGKGDDTATGTSSAFGGHPLWGTPQTDQIFGQ